MKKTLIFLSVLASTLTASAAGASDAISSSIRSQYSQGKITADSVVSLALYHKGFSPEVAERCLELPAADGHLRSVTELGVIYTFSPEFASRRADGVKLLEAAAKGGYKVADEYLGLYYYTNGDYARAKACFDAAYPFRNGFAYAALGGMYVEGKGVRYDPAKVRENYRQSALKGYPRGQALYGFNLRTKTGGAIDYPNAFYWLYIAGDLGDEAARVTLYLPRRTHVAPTTETEKQAQTALALIEAAHRGQSISKDPIYKDGFLKGLRSAEQAADHGDDWARYYLGSMNYNGDFLNQNYPRAILYYEQIADNASLPSTALAVVNERLAEMYRDGKGVAPDRVKADRYARAAARYGSLQAYRSVEKTH